MNNVYLATQTWAQKNAMLCHAFSTTGSTNDEAKNFSYSDDRPHLFLAATQSAGRGRGKNTWLNSQIGEALLSTWALHLKDSPQPITTPLVGLALYQACVEIFPNLEWSMKAPNDIYIGDQKVAGILVENLDYSDHHRLLIGLGMNFLGKPKNLPVATSVQEHLSGPLADNDYHQLLQIFYKNLQNVRVHFAEKHLNSQEQEDLFKALKRHSKFKDLLRVQKDGSLDFLDRTISWTDL